MIEPNGSQGTVQLLLLPGMDGTGQLFAPLLGALGGVEPVVISYPPDEPLGYGDLLTLVRNRLPHGRPFILLGESFSGPLALMVAAEAPKGLQGVILCATFAKNPFGWLPACSRHLVRPVLFRMTLHFVVSKVLLGKSATPELRAQLARARRAVQPAVLAARARAIFNVDVLPQLVSCPVPILYLRGQYDHLLSNQVVRQLSRHKPSIQFTTLPASHLVLQTAPVLSAHAIEAFARQCAST
jgi:pimeloyl-ACP methyl ester carboxylesterase